MVSGVLAPVTPALADQRDDFMQLYYNGKSPDQDYDRWRQRKNWTDQDYADWYRRHFKGDVGVAGLFGVQIDADGDVLPAGAAPQMQAAQPAPADDAGAQPQMQSESQPQSQPQPQPQQTFTTRRAPAPQSGGFAQQPDGGPVPEAQFGQDDGSAQQPPQGFSRYDDARPVPEAGGEPGAGGDADWAARCAAKYKSFDPATGNYRAYTGEYRRCEL
ncbi:BA14K family protein [Faunimonas pinastri]|nr:BA14K family protein [Faunimonas pinastri]